MGDVLTITVAHAHAHLLLILLSDPAPPVLHHLWLISLYSALEALMLVEWSSLLSSRWACGFGLTVGWFHLKTAVATHVRVASAGDVAGSCEENEGQWRRRQARNMKSRPRRT